jgi:hypothetical protein
MQRDNFFLQDLHPEDQDFTLPSEWLQATAVDAKCNDPQQQKNTEKAVKRKRGRPRTQKPKVDAPKRKRGRPRKKRKTVKIEGQLACTSDTHCDRCLGASASPLLQPSEQTDPCCTQTLCKTRTAAFAGFITDGRLQPTNASRRFSTYRATDRWLHGSGVMGVRRRLRRCIYVLVRRTWPSDSYTGYRP